MKRFSFDNILCLVGIALTLWGLVLLVSAHAQVVPTQKTCFVAYTQSATTPPGPLTQQCIDSSQLPAPAPPVIGVPKVSGQCPAPTSGLAIYADLGATCAPIVAVPAPGFVAGKLPYCGPASAPNAPAQCMELFAGTLEKSGKTPGKWYAFQPVPLVKVP